MARFVRADVVSGRYATASEVIRASLRMMVDHSSDSAPLPPPVP
ncbi:ribbon-helix-helix domain-containing protein [Sphingomonas melonis]